MPENTSMVPMVGAAVIIGGAILTGSWMVKSSVEATGTQIQSGLTETKVALEKVASSTPPAAQPARRGPDPNKKYTIKTAGAPAKGGSAAKVQIVEFSDFQ